MSTIFEEKTGKLIGFRKHVVLNPKQLRFFRARKKYVAYGGARGGGKSFGLRVLFSVLCLHYSRLRILLLRRTYPELEANHILPLQQELKGLAVYKAYRKMFIFPNGSFIKLGHCATDADAMLYMGQEYDYIGFEEATSFTEYILRLIATCLRTIRTDIIPRIYFTCNPGGPGHYYIKRLFLDREYEGAEKPEDYEFILALVYDNEILMQNNPDYIQMLNNMPADMIQAHRDGDWDALSGAYFKEFKRDVHVIEPFVIPSHWYIYFVMDYGLDCLAGYWVADDHDGHYYFIKEVWETDLIISAAARRIHEVTGEDTVQYYYAPPDMKARAKDTGKTALELFGENGIPLTMTRNDRVEGWLCVKEMLKVYEVDGVKTASLKIFSNCTKLIRHIPLVQRDEKNPNDVSNTPHELTHSVDALRYFAGEYSKPYKVPESHISGIYHRNELKMMGYNDSQINTYVKLGYIQLIGR